MSRHDSRHRTRPKIKGRESRVPKVKGENNTRNKIRALRNFPPLRNGRDLVGLEPIGMKQGFNKSGVSPQHTQPQTDTLSQVKVQLHESR